MKKLKKTKLQRRLVVVKDAIKQIKRDNIIPDHSGVLRIYGHSQRLFTNLSGQAQEVLTKELKGTNRQLCLVCARGALLIAKIHKENQCTNLALLGVQSKGAYWNGSVTDSKLLKLFSGKQIKMMESAFEGLRHPDIGTVKLDACIDYKRFFPDPKKRLLAIFNNVVKNKGLFKP